MRSSDRKRQATPAATESADPDASKTQKEALGKAVADSVVGDDANAAWVKYGSKIEVSSERDRGRFKKYFNGRKATARQRLARRETSSSTVTSTSAAASAAASATASATSGTSHPSAEAHIKRARASPKEKATQFQSGDGNPAKRPKPNYPTNSRGGEIDTAARAASRSTAMQADRCTSAKTLEQREWEDATVFAKQELSRRLEEAEAQKQEHPQKKKQRPQLSPQSHHIARSTSYKKAQIWRALLPEVKRRFPGCNWDDRVGAALPMCPVRTLNLAQLLKQMSDIGSDATPNRRGRVPHLPPELGRAVRATVQLQQQTAQTGGAHRKDIKAYFKAAIKGSPYEELYALADDLLSADSKFDRAYYTWLRNEGGAMSKAAVTNDAETDINRIQWIRMSVLTLWQFGIFGELIRLGFMEAISEALPAGHPGSDAKWGEYGMNYTQGRYRRGAKDLIFFGDERDVSLGYEPKKGGRNIQVFAKRTEIRQDGVVTVLEMQRLQASMKRNIKTTCFGSLTLSGKTMANLYIMASTAKPAPEISALCPLPRAVF
jgi:hypothetical protein